MYAGSHCAVECFSSSAPEQRPCAGTFPTRERSDQLSFAVTRGCSFAGRVFFLKGPSGLGSGVPTRFLGIRMHSVYSGLDIAVDDELAAWLDLLPVALRNPKAAARPNTASGPQYRHA